MKARYIKTMDFTFEDVEILGVSSEKELLQKMDKGKIIKINNEGQVEYINSSYVMYFALQGGIND